MPSMARISDRSRLGGINVLPRHDLCVPIMVWNQASAIHEWIKYHSWLGVERWFIYENNSFGPSGLTTLPPHGVTIGYTFRLQSLERHKSIVRPNALASTLLNVVYHFWLQSGFDYLNIKTSCLIVNVLTKRCFYIFLHLHKSYWSSTLDP